MTFMSCDPRELITLIDGNVILLTEDKQYTTYGDINLIIHHI